MTKKLAWITISILVIVTAYISSFLPQLYFDYDFNSFFNPSDSSTYAYKQHQEKFGTDNDFILIGIESETTALDSAYLSRIESLTAHLKTGPYIEDVVSATTLQSLVREPLTGALIKRPYITYRPSDVERIGADHSNFRTLFSDDFKSSSVLVSHQDGLSKSKCDTLSRFVEDALADWPDSKVHVAGRSIGQAVYIETIESEFFLFLILSLVFVISFLWLMFRNLIGILVPLIAVGFSVIWTMGIIYASNIGISLLMTMIPPVIFVVGISDCIHLYARFLEEFREGNTLDESIKIMIKKTGVATLITSVTTAIGFASLYFTQVPALQNFGFVTAAGVLATYFVSIALMPALLKISTHRAAKQQRDTRIENTIEKLVRFSVNRYRQVRVASLLLIIVLAWAGYQVEQNNFLLEDMREGTKIKDDFDFFDSHFSGVRPFEMGIQLHENFDLTREKIEKLNGIDQYLETNYGVGAIQSLPQVAKELNKTYHAGKPAYYRLPNTERAWNFVLSNMEKLIQSGKLDHIVAQGHNYLRIFGRAPDYGGKVFTQKNTELNQFLSGESATLGKFILTGTGHLIDLTNQNLVYSLGTGLGLAFALISVLMAFLFRSVRMLVISLIPNLLPLLAVTAIMAATGIDLKLTTGIIFTITFGIAVDDTIHILSRYILELRDGKSKNEALMNAFSHTGKALVITTLILVGGFSTLCASSFQGTFYIGLLVTLTLILALVFDLVALPAWLYSSANGTSFPKK